MDQKNLVITIGRQYGSGGREIGAILARKLDVAYYDKELVYRAAENSGYAVEAFNKQNEEGARGLAWLFSYGASPAGTANISPAAGPLDDRLFVAQASTIKDIARQQSCVIVGRCADYVLAEMHDEINVIDIFLVADHESRMRRVMRRNDLDEEQAVARIKQIAPRRERYYERYTDRKWADARNYDLVINTSYLDAQKVADLIVDLAIARGFVAPKGQ